MVSLPPLPSLDLKVAETVSPPCRSVFCLFGIRSKEWGRRMHSSGASEG